MLFDGYVEKIHASLYENASQILTAKNRNAEDIIIEINCGEYIKTTKPLFLSKI